MPNVKLFTVFSSKKNFINMNYSIFKRSNNNLISTISTHARLQRYDYNRGNLLQRKKLLLLNEMQIPNKLSASLTTSNVDNLADKMKDCASDNNIKEQQDQSTGCKEQGTTMSKDSKEQGSSIIFKGIAYMIYASEILLASNELKLMKQLAIKGYIWAQNLFRTHVLENPNIQEALNDVKAKAKKD